MLGRITDFFRGRARLFAPQEYAEALLEFLFSEKITASVRADGEKGGIYVDLSPAIVKKIAPALDKLNIKVYIISIKGFCALFSGLRTRPGAVLGAILFALLLWVSALPVWRVDIVGAESLDGEMLRDELSDLGVGVGCLISEIDTAAVGNALLLSHPELSWAALDVTGTTVTLTVRKTASDHEAPDSRPTLMVAAESGVVESVLVYSGAAAVTVGSVVKAGDVLINGYVSGSGLQYSDIPLLRVGEADGSVRAAVNRKLSVTVPLSETVSEAHDGNARVRVKREVSVFGRRLSFGGGEPQYPFEASVRRYNLTVFGVIELPIEVTETRMTELKERVIVRVAEDAELEARRRAAEAVREGVGDGELYSVSYHAELTESGVTVTAEYRCSAEIASPKRLSER